MNKWHLECNRRAIMIIKTIRFPSNRMELDHTPPAQILSPYDKIIYANLMLNGIMFNVIPYLNTYVHVFQIYSTLVSCSFDCLLFSGILRESQFCKLSSTVACIQFPAIMQRGLSRQPSLSASSNIQLL